MQSRTKLSTRGSKGSSALGGSDANAFVLTGRQLAPNGGPASDVVSREGNSKDKVLATTVPPALQVNRRPQTAAARQQCGGRGPLGRGTKTSSGAQENELHLFVGSDALAQNHEQQGRDVGAQSRPQSASNARFTIRDKAERERNGEHELSAWARLTQHASLHVGELAGDWAGAGERDRTRESADTSRQDAELWARRFAHSVFDHSDFRESPHDIEALATSDEELWRYDGPERTIGRTDGVDVAVLENDRVSKESCRISPASSLSSVAPGQRIQSFEGIGCERTTHASLGVTGRRHRASENLCGGDLPKLSAPGLEDARALLRKWIDSEDTFGGLEDVGLGGFESKKLFERNSIIRDSYSSLLERGRVREQGGNWASGGNQRPVSTDFNNELCDTALCVDEVHRQHARHDEEVAYERDGEVAEEKEPTFSVSSKNLSFP